MTHRSHLGILAAAAIILTAAAVPAHAGSWFSFTVGFGAGSWAPYGTAWSDPGWSLDHRVALASYGEWVWVDGLGTVWRPWVAASWRPYTHGRWLWTSFGWTWVAYEPWGWLPHHYGSWALAPVGWVWTPGNEYRPANVVWVSSGSFVGWYPRGPAGWSHRHRGFVRGYSHGYHDGYHRGQHSGYRSGYHDGWQDALEATWVDRRHVGAEDLSRHAVDTGRLSRSGVVAKAAVLESAPARAELDRYAAVRIPEARVATRTVEVGGRQVVAVRPEGVEETIARNSLTTARTALSPAVAERVERQVAEARSAAPRIGATDLRQPAAHADAEGRDRRAPQAADGRSAAAATGQRAASSTAPSPARAPARVRTSTTAATVQAPAAPSRPGGAAAGVPDASARVEARRPAAAPSRPTTADTPSRERREPLAASASHQLSSGRQAAAKPVRPAPEVTRGTAPSAEAAGRTSAPSATSTSPRTVPQPATATAPAPRGGEAAKPSTRPQRPPSRPEAATPEARNGAEEDSGPTTKPASPRKAERQR